MAKIDKKGDTVTITLHITELEKIQEKIEDGANIAARHRHFSHGNPRVYRKSEFVMKFLWRLSDFMGIPTETNISYTSEQDFR